MDWNVPGVVAMIAGIAYLVIAMYADYVAHGGLLSQG
jgi:hypothetical protein